MKLIPRSGWVSHGVSLHDVESVAAHTFSMGALSLLLADLEARRGMQVNIERVLRLALLHDLSESLTFDISKAYLAYIGKRGEAIKRELERSAWKHIVQGIKNPALIRDYTNLQEEYITRQTLEAKVVHAADNLDILLQIVDYVQKGYPYSLFEDLWNERRKMLIDSSIPSVRKIHTILEKEMRRVIRQVK